MKAQLSVLTAILLFNMGAWSTPGPQQTRAQDQAHPQISASEYRRAVAPNPANPPGPAQPIPFSHRLHLTLGLQCSGCHTNPSPGFLMTFPTTAKCMSCHQSVGTSLPAIRKLATYAKSGKPIPWVRVYVLLKGVEWTHRKHLGAEIACETCHGPVNQMDVMREATGVTAMSVCLKCHQMNGAPTTCQTCHAWPKIGPNGEPSVKQ